MLAFLIIIGGIAGAAGFGINGILPGGLLGYLLARSIKAEKTIRELQTALKQVNGNLATLSVHHTKSNESQAPTGQDTPAPVQPDKRVETLVNTTATTPALKPSLTATKSSRPHVEPPSPVKEDAWVATRTAYPAAEDPVWLRAIKSYFTGGNTLVRVGVIILFIGIAFLAKYAAERGIIPIEFRMAGIALTGLALMVVGWRLRHNRLGYAVALQGGGIGITYLTIFASFRLYHLLPPTMVFSLMLLVCMLSAALAVLLNARSLAILGFSFGFLAPVLTSTGGGSHVALFSYYTLLNFGILAIAWYRSWRPLNLIGFFFTFVIGSIWGAKNYQPELFQSTEPFLVGFFLFYIALSVLYAIRQPVNLRGYVDGTLVFGTPIVVFGLQYTLVHTMEYGLAYSALALFSFYVLLAYGLFKFVAGYNNNDGLRLLCISFLSIGVVFGTVAIPLALDDRWTAAAWALEGAALVYVGVQQRRDLPYFTGLLLQFAAAWFVLWELGRATHSNHWPLLNGVYLNGLLMAVAGLSSAFFSYRYCANIKRYIKGTDVAMLGWGIGWWLFIGVYEIYRHASRTEFMAWLLILGVATVVCAHTIGQRLMWGPFKQLDRALILFMLLALVGSIDTLSHPFDQGTWIAWVIAYVTFYILLKRDDQSTLSQLQQFLHGAGIWLATTVVTWEAFWWVEQWLPRPSVWGFTVWVLIPSMVFTAIHRLTKSTRWPFKPHAALYIGFVSIPIVAFTAIAVVAGNLSQTGNPAPLPYVPLLNPLDITDILAIILILSWWVKIQPARNSVLPYLETKVFYSGIGIITFILINSALVKTIHHWYHVPLTFASMMRSDLAQTSLTLLWSIIAMMGMIIASRRGWRQAWLIGGSLLSVVVVKLFLVDLANVGTVERIVSFIFVGGLMLVIGYFTPLPPKAQVQRNA